MKTKITFSTAVGAVNSIVLPKIESISTLSNSQIREFMRYGFCYFKVPKNRALQAAMADIRTHALDFYRQDISEKEKYPLDQKAYKGYWDKKRAENPELAEQLIFYPEDPIPPFMALQPQITTIINGFYHEIGYPLLKSVFMLADGPDSYKEVVRDPTIIMGFIYYPDKTTVKVKSSTGLYAHQDWGYISMLHINKPGLFAKIENSWVPINPIEDYIVVNLGYCAEITLNGACTALHHEARIPDSERLSYGVFIAPNMKAPIKNVVTGEIISPSYADLTQTLFASSYRKRTSPELLSASNNDESSEPFNVEKSKVINKS